MGRKRNNALRQEQDQHITMITNRQNQFFYQKHERTKASNTINFVGPKYRRRVDLHGKTANQENYISALTDPEVDVVVGSGPAGTGKTYLATLAGIRELRSSGVERIILTRPAVGVEDEQHGFLPGDLNAKMEPWTRPLLDVFREYYAAKEIEAMLADGVIEIAPLAYMRGRTFKNSWIILDEAQNATPGQIKMLLTRIGEGSKVIVTGDIEQTDRETKDNGLLDLQSRLKHQPSSRISLCGFDVGDVQRHRIIELVLRLYNQ